MSNTFNTNKAREQRKLFDKWRKVHSGRVAEVSREIDALEVSGERYGNNRKVWAAEKVKDRRVERKRANSEAKRNTDE